MSAEKQEFLVGYDYGMGGLWGVMLARTADEIKAKYPELEIARERPAWMTLGRYEQLRKEQLHDIDGAPWGILNAVLADRNE